MTPTLDALVRQLREAMAQGKFYEFIRDHHVATLLDALTAAQQKACDIGTLADYEESRLKAEAARLREQVTALHVACAAEEQAKREAWDETRAAKAEVSALQGELAEALTRANDAFDALSDARKRGFIADDALREMMALATEYEAERDAAREALRQAIVAAYCDVPVPGHEGSCGPESSCDGICAESASRLAQIREWRAALGQPAESEPAEPQPSEKDPA